ncbi:MAG: hypothetical protein GXO26_07715 [Crenarchaeota archaeon]|nr:hypothetical protein [Thermoproteota archaeon]
MTEWEKFLRRIRRLKIDSIPMYKYSVMYRSLVYVDVIKERSNLDKVGKMCVLGITLYPTENYEYVVGELQLTDEVEEKSIYEQTVFVTNDYNSLYEVFKTISTRGKWVIPKWAKHTREIMLPEKEFENLLNMFSNKNFLLISRVRYENDIVVERETENLKLLMSIPDIGSIMEDILDILRESKGICSVRTIKPRVSGKGYSVNIGVAIAKKYKRYTIPSLKYGHIIVLVPLSTENREGKK